MPFSVIVDGKEYDADCSNLLYETIVSIAEEVVFSYKFLNKPHISPRQPRQDYMLNVYEYSIDKEKRYKYTICKNGINLYNTNRYWQCTIKSFPIESYDLLFRSRVFGVSIIAIDNCDLN